MNLFRPLAPVVSAKRHEQLHRVSSVAAEAVFSASLVRGHMNVCGSPTNPALQAPYRAAYTGFAAFSCFTPQASAQAGRKRPGSLLTYLPAIKEKRGQVLAALLFL